MLGFSCCLEYLSLFFFFCEQKLMGPPSRVKQSLICSLILTFERRVSKGGRIQSVILIEFFSSLFYYVYFLRIVLFLIMYQLAFLSGLGIRSGESQQVSNEYQWLLLSQGDNSFELSSLWLLLQLFNIYSINNYCVSNSNVMVIMAISLIIVGLIINISIKFYMFSDENTSMEEYTDIFGSVKELLNVQNSMIILPSYQLPNKFKAIILFQTYNNSSPKPSILKHHYFVKWYINSTNKYSQAINRILTRGQISKQSFLYRLKLAGSNNRVFKRPKLLSIDVNCLSHTKNNFTHEKKPSILKSNSKIGQSANTFKQVKHEQQDDFNNDDIIKRSSRVIPSLKQVIEDKVYKSTKNITSVMEIPENKQTGTMLYFDIDTPGFPRKKSSLKENSQQFPNSLNMIQDTMKCILRNRLKESFDMLKGIWSDQNDYEGQLLIAKRNLELVELNFQIQNEIKQINENYYEHCEQLERLEQKMDNFQANITCYKILMMVKTLKSMIYPQLRILFDCIEFVDTKEQDNGIMEIEEHKRNSIYFYSINSIEQEQTSQNQI